jgi:type IV secretion system protein VirD4
MSDDAFEKALRDDLPRGHDDRAVARWLNPDELTGKTWDPKGGMLLGKRAGRAVGCNDDRHIMTIAGPRAGTGVSLLTPNLMFYEGSALVIDPRGELARLTAARRGAGANDGRGGLGQNVHVLDPYGVSGLQRATFNPLAQLSLDTPTLIDDAGVLADALITHPHQGVRHWTESAQALLRALILVAVADAAPSNRTLTRVRQLLTLTHPRIATRIAFQTPTEIDYGPLTAQDALIRILKHEEGPHAHICHGVAEQLDAMPDYERYAVLSSARTQTQWLDSEQIEPLLAHSDFQLADLKRNKTTIYLCLPATRFATHANWLRLMILLAITVMERTNVTVKQPVLFVLDEFPVLGHMELIERAAGLMPGFGVKLWLLVQNIGQLKRHYKDAWETFLANCGTITAFGIADNDTLKTLSEALGRMTIIEKVPSGSTQSALLQGAAASSPQDHRREVPLLAEHELRLAFGREKNRILIFNAETNPAVAERFIYYSDRDRSMFQGLYDPDPAYAAGRGS